MEWTDERRAKHSQAKMLDAEKTLARRFWSNVEKSDGGCWMWIGTKVNKGYGVIGYRGKAIGAHRMSYIIHHGEIPDGMILLHSCDNPSCVNPDHLRLGTRAENCADKVAKGRQNRGETNSNAKVTETDVIEMRRLYANGSTCAELAEKYSLSGVGVWQIVTGRNWKHIPGPVGHIYGTQEWKDRISEGKMGILPSPEHLASIRRARAMPRSEEYRQKLGAAHKGIPSWNKGIPMTEETKAKLSAAKMGRVPWNKGKAMSDEQKAKLSAAHMGKKKPRHKESNGSETVTDTGHRAEACTPVA